MNHNKQLLALVLSGITLGAYTSSISALQGLIKTSTEQSKKEVERIKPTKPAPVGKFSAEAQEQLDTILNDISTTDKVSYNALNAVNKEASDFVTDHANYFKGTTGDLFKTTVKNAYDKKINELFKDEIEAVNKEIENREEANIEFAKRIKDAVNKPGLAFIKLDIEEKQAQLATMIDTITNNLVDGTKLELNNLDPDSTIYSTLKAKRKELKKAYKDLLKQITAKEKTFKVEVEATLDELADIRKDIVALNKIETMNELNQKNDAILKNIKPEWRQAKSMQETLTYAYNKQKKAIEDKANIVIDEKKEQTLEQAVAQLKQMQKSIKENPTEKEKETFTKQWKTYHKRSGASFGSSANKYYGSKNNDKDGKYTEAWKALYNNKGFAKMLQ